MKARMVSQPASHRVKPGFSPKPAKRNLAPRSDDSPSPSPSTQSPSGMFRRVARAKSRATTRSLAVGKLKNGTVTFSRTRR